MKPVAQPPFYAAEIRPAIVCLTSTGLRVDRDMHVLDCADRPIGGLFSAGEVSGGVLGDRSIGGGTSIANAIVFGRVARSEEHTSELQSLMRLTYAVFCLKKNKSEIRPQRQYLQS